MQIKNTIKVRASVEFEFMADLELTNRKELQKLVKEFEFTTDELKIRVL